LYPVEGICYRVEGILNSVEGISYRVEGISNPIEGICYPVEGILNSVEGILHHPEGMPDIFEVFRHGLCVFLVSERILASAGLPSIGSSKGRRI